MKRIKGLFAIVLFGMILLITGNNTVRAEYYEFNFSFSDTIRGTAGEVLSGQIYTINLGSTPLVRPLPQGADISSWFSGSTSPKPAGMQVVVYEEAEVGARSLKVEFKGKVLGASRDTVTMRVPLPYFVADQTNYSYVCDVKVSGGGKYNIVRNFTAPSGYMGVGHGIYFDKSQNGGNGFKLTGEKGVALPANGCELNVVIDGCFIRKVDAGKDITSWFTGHVIAQNMTYNTSLNSQLPPGITVKIKNTVKVGDNSFTMVFSGTPTKGSKDIIAITIPAGYVTYNPGAASDYMGDLQDALKTYNASGHFVYDIFSSDNDYKSVYVMATYPDATIHAGSIYTEEDGLEITYQLVGTNASGVPYRFKNISVGSNFKGYIVNNAYNGTCPETITMHTGLTPKVTYVSEDESVVKATIVGTAKKTNSLSLLISSGAFMQLNSSFSTYGNFVDFVASEDTHLYFGQPDPQITVSNDITIESTFFDETPTISETTFTINLGNDTLARSFTKGDNLQLFAYKSSSDPETSLTNPEKQWTTREKWNNLYLKVAENASAGSREIKVNLYSAGAIETDYYGYLYLALPRSYLTNATAYGSDGQYEQASYPIENSRIFLNVEKYENYYAKASDVRLEGYFHRGYLYVDILQEDKTEESGYRVVGRDRKEYFDGGIGKGKVSFTIETLQDINVGKDYAAGASVKDLIRLNRMTVETSPFQNNIGDHPVFYQYWENYYDIHTAKAISKDNEGEEKAHVFELYFDLSEIQAQQPSNTKIILEIFDGKNWKTVYTSNRCIFDIDGEIFETYDEKEYAEYKRKYNYQAGSSASDGEDSFDAGIIYDKQDVIIYAKDASGAYTEGTYINLTTEKFVTDLDYKCYSIDGGEKWKAATKKLTDKNISSMLNKGMTFVIADKFDSKAKKPSNDAIVYTFATLNARPAAPKFKVDYAEYADQTGATTGQWALTDASGTLIGSSELAKLDIGATDSKGKTVTEAGYGSWPSSGGLFIAPLDGTKVAAHTYFVRVAPTTDTPASKVVKVKVKGQQKAPKLKVDYKKEILKAKKDMIVYFGDTPIASAGAVAGEPKTYSDLAGKYIVVDEDMAKNGIDISAYITDKRNTIMVWSGATVKKASSAAQTIVLAARQNITEAELSPSGGKLKLDKKYEVYDETKGKWGSLPKVEESCELKIRLKATAKGGAESDTTYAASNTATLAITYGEYEAGKDKLGIKAADIVIK